MQDKLWIYIFVWDLNKTTDLNYKQEYWKNFIQVLTIFRANSIQYISFFRADIWKQGEQEHFI